MVNVTAYATCQGTGSQRERMPQLGERAEDGAATYLRFVYLHSSSRILQGGRLRAV